MIVAASPIVLFEQMPHKFGRDHLAIEERAAGQVIPHKAAQRAAEPAPQRHAETSLGLAQQFGRQPMAHGANEDVFDPAILELPGVRNTRRQLRQFVIQHWAAHFQRVRHRHAIHFHQHVSGQLGDGLEIQRLRERISARRAAAQCAILRLRNAPSAGGIHSGVSKRCKR